MIVDQRCYTLHPGRIPGWLETMNNEGFEMQRAVLGEPVGYYYTEFGPLNQIVHMWAYEDLEERRTRREKLRSIPEWNVIRDHLMPYVHHQENKLLMPAPYYKVR